MKPILFNTQMVKAILDGKKTVTRRIVKPKSKDAIGIHVSQGKVLEKFKCGVITNEVKPPYMPGDVLYVRETWSEWTDGYVYRAWVGPFPQVGESHHMRWHPAIHMPKEAARIFLKVKSVRFENLQDITEEQAEREGAEKCIEVIRPDEDNPVTYIDDNGYFVLGFKNIWDSTIKKSDIGTYGWNANPWVWVIEFERCDKPIE